MSGLLPFIGLFVITVLEIVRKKRSRRRMGFHIWGTSYMNVFSTWYRSSERDEHDCSHRIFQANGASEVGSQVSYESCQYADHEDGDNETGPAIPVFCRGDEGEEDLPEHSQKMHHVIETGGQLLLPTFVIIVVFPWREERSTKHHNLGSVGSSSLQLPPS